MHSGMILYTGLYTGLRNSVYDLYTEVGPI